MCVSVEKAQHDQCQGMGLFSLLPASDIEQTTSFQEDNFSFENLTYAVTFITADIGIHTTSTTATILSRVIERRRNNRITGSLWALRSITCSPFSLVFFLVEHWAGS